jgi:tetratricopeptide (TPR) repeat protein
MDQRPNQQHSLFPPEIIAYYATLAVLFGCSFLTEYRVWGIDWWGYCPIWVRIALLIVGVVTPLIVDRLFVRTLSGQSDIPRSTYRNLVIVYSIALCALFFLLRTRTHFLGDGYTLLSLLGSDNPFIKPRNLGGTIFQYWILKLIGGRDEAASLVAYRIVSFGAGIIFLATVIWSAAKLVGSYLGRFLFVIALSSAGYALLFFGYVENYALFVVAVTAFGLVCQMIVADRLNRFWIVPSLALVIFLHILGVVLVPIAAYLLVRGTKSGNWFAARSMRVTLVSVLISVAVGAAALYYYYQSSLFFQIAILPIVANKFTVGGYTLFSLNHLIDFGNLLFALFPGIAVAIVWWARSRQSLDSGTYLVLIGAAVCCLGAAFVFDPKLGMPRDWDLFAFSGIPLVLVLVWPMVGQVAESAVARRALVCIGVLSALVLISRAAVLIEPSRATAAIEDYVSLDPLKSASSRFLVLTYYDHRFDTAQVVRLKRKWDPELLTYDMEKDAVQLMERGQTGEALAKLRRLVAIRPNTYSAWENLGKCFYLAGQFDSALSNLRIADGMNPYSASTLSNIGVVLAQMGRYDDARDNFSRALRSDSLFSPAWKGLAAVYRETSDTVKYLGVLERVAARPSPPIEIWDELIGYYLSTGQTEQARETLSQAISKGLDSTRTQAILQRYPALRP